MSESILPQGMQESFDPELRRAFEFADKSVDPSLVDHSKIKMHKDKIKLSGDGTFYTLQGEGPTMGLPCVFIRLHVCNLKCTWCDAWYTWNPNTEEFWTEGRNVSFEECAELIRQTWACNNSRVRPRVIWTGGEPLIQRKQIDEVTKLLNPGIETSPGNPDWEPEWDVEIETNGTLMPSEWQLDWAQFNCSPKLANSDNREFARIKPRILNALDNANTTFKFVVCVPEDLDEIERDFLPHISMDKVIVMPQGITEEEVSANAKILAEPCKEKGFRLMPRLQNICWDGARRGV